MDRGEVLRDGHPAGAAFVRSGVYNIAVLHRPDRISFSACLARVLAERRLTSSELIARLPHLHFVSVYRLLSGAIGWPAPTRSRRNRTSRRAGRSRPWLRATTRAGDRY